MLKKKKSRTLRSDSTHKMEEEEKILINMTRKVNIVGVINNS